MQLFYNPAANFRC